MRSTSGAEKENRKDHTINSRHRQRDVNVPTDICERHIARAAERTGAQPATVNATTDVVGGAGSVEWKGVGSDLYEDKSTTKNQSGVARSADAPAFLRDRLEQATGDLESVSKGVKVTDKSSTPVDDGV